MPVAVPLSHRACSNASQLVRQSVARRVPIGSGQGVQPDPETACDSCHSAWKLKRLRWSPTSVGVTEATCNPVSNHRLAPGPQRLRCSSLSRRSVPSRHPGRLAHHRSSRRHRRRPPRAHLLLKRPRRLPPHRSPRQCRYRLDARRAHQSGGRDSSRKHHCLRTCAWRFRLSRAGSPAHCRHWRRCA